MRTNILFAGLAAALLGILPAASAATPEQIYTTLRGGNPAEVESLLSGGVSANDRDENGNTLLMRAALYGGPKLLRLLIDKGADVNAANNAGATALMRAAGDYASVKLLVEKGADVNAKSALGNTPLILAARAHPSAAAVKLLLEHGANVNATNVFGASAIMTAAASGDVDSVRVLLKHGADVNAHSRGSEPAVIWGGGRSPLMWAAFHGDTQMMKLLIEAGAQVNESEGFGTALIQTAWGDRKPAAEFLLKAGADAKARDFQTGYTALHWAASSESDDNGLVDLLLQNGADPSCEGGQEVDAFLGIGQTPLMLAHKRGDTKINKTLTALGAKVNKTRERPLERGHRELKGGIDATLLRSVLNAAIPPLEETAIASKKVFDARSPHKCVSCHQQYLPMAATALAGSAGGALNKTAEEALAEMVRTDSRNLDEITQQATFHPEPGHSYGYVLFALNARHEPADPVIDGAVHHLLVIQDKNGEWHNNLPRPPIQTSDVAPTALAIKALKSYGFPGRAKEIETRIARARTWLNGVQAANTEELTYQIMGLAWAGHAPAKLRKLSAALLREQRADGGWAQLETLESDAYATGQALFALHAAGLSTQSAAYEKGLAYLVKTQLEDGTWHVARRAFPFQPTMKSGFPHGRDSWISASGTSWAVMAISLALEGEPSGRLTASK